MAFNLIISRQDAKRQGLSKYFTGKPCKHGHLSKRNVDTRVCIECRKEYRKIYKEQNKKYINGYREKNKEHIKECSKDYKKRNKETIKKYTKEYREQNKDYIKKQESIYREQNKEHYRESKREYQKNRKKIDINFKIRINLRNRLGRIIKNNTKKGSAVRDLGCSIDKLKIHLESQFEPWMTWDNYGQYGWHIDHIKPLSKFDLTDREQFLEAVHFTNLQPMHWRENIIKYNKVIK